MRSRRWASPQVDAADKAGEDIVALRTYFSVGAQLEKPSAEHATILRH